MNMFWLDKDLKKSAAYHFDSHVGKMGMELTQMLCAAIHISMDPDRMFVRHKTLGKEEISMLFWAIGGREFKIYRLSHKNHPCSIWVRESMENWEMTFDFATALFEEDFFRRGKIHDSFKVLKELPKPPLKRSGLTPPPKAMPEGFQKPGNSFESVIESYRNFYINGKKKSMRSWRKRNKPTWFKEKE